MRLLALFVSSLLLASGPVFAADAASIIEKARRSVGPESVLRELVTIVIRGEVQPVDPKLPDAKITLTARKPCSQRLEVTWDDIVETTLLHGPRAAVLRSSLSEGTSQIRRLSEPESDRVRMNTRQFFTFFEVDPARGERVAYVGIEDRWGVRCHRLTYHYPKGFEVDRFFSVADGRLVSTLSDMGVESVEIGRQTVGGIGFPERIDYYQGETMLHSVVLTEVKVNRPLKEGIFNLPRSVGK